MDQGMIAGPSALKECALGIRFRGRAVVFRPQGIDLGDEVACRLFVAAENVGKAGFPGICGAAKILGEAVGGLGEGTAAGHFP